jgi:hypothetical protein
VGNAAHPPPPSHLRALLRRTWKKSSRRFTELIEAATSRVEVAIEAAAEDKDRKMADFFNMTTDMFELQVGTAEVFTPLCYIKVKRGLNWPKQLSSVAKKNYFTVVPDYVSNFPRKLSNFPRFFPRNFGASKLP